MIGDTLNGAGTHVAVLDGTVFDALGQLQGKYDAEFVARMITMFMETALVLLIRLKEGVANGDFVALHHASHESKSCSATIGAYSLAAHCERLEVMVREACAGYSFLGRSYRYRISARRSRFDWPLGRAGSGSIRSSPPDYDAVPSTNPHRETSVRNTVTGF